MKNISDINLLKRLASEGALFILFGGDNCSVKYSPSITSHARTQLSADALCLCRLWGFTRDMRTIRRF